MAQAISLDAAKAQDKDLPRGRVKSRLVSLAFAARARTSRSGSIRASRRTLSFRSTIKSRCSEWVDAPRLPLQQDSNSVAVGREGEAENSRRLGPDNVAGEDSPCRATDAGSRRPLDPVSRGQGRLGEGEDETETLALRI